jgi:hypothetical protein
MPTPALAARTASVLSSLAVVAAGTVLATGAPAEAATHLTDYGFQTRAYGSIVRAEQAGFRSDRTAYSWVACTRLTGRHDDAHVTTVDAPASNPSLKLGAVTSHSATYRHRVAGIVGTRSTNSIASITLGPADGPHISIDGLKTSGDAWATRDGKLHAKGTFTSAGISAKTGTPLDAALGQVNAGIGTLFQQIQQQTNGVLDVPGVGRFSMGGTHVREGRYAAAVDAIALRVTLYGPDGVAGGGDDSLAIIGRSRARITKDLPAGLFYGRGTALDAQLLNGVGAITLADRPLDCAGTRGKVVRTSTAHLDVGNAGVVVVGATNALAYGLQHENRTASAWTESSVAEVTIGGAGGITIKGIVGRANLRQLRSGKVRTNTAGSSIGSLSVQGQAQQIPDPGQAIEVPGVAKVQFFVREKTRRAVKVTAVRITLLDSTPGVSVINLGMAKVGIQRR